MEPQGVTCMPIRAKSIANEQNTQPKVFRVTGLPLKESTAVEEDLKRLITENLAENEGHIKSTIQCIPSCDSAALNALVEFKPACPRFLEAIEKDPFGSYELEMGEDDITFDSHFQGFTQLYPTKDPISLDIIAITGLAGHAYGSWRGRGNLGRMWLRHFLSKDLPHCRTMTYGYNSRLSTHGVGTIQDLGQSFLEGLKRVRNTEELRKRPVVFIAHSLGGIILTHALVKAAMATSSERVHPSLRALHKSTYGILFFGTPHKGLFVDDLLEMLKSENPRRRLVEELRPNSDVLRSQVAHFREIALDYQLISFYELNQTRRLKWNFDSENWERSGENVTKVDPESGLFGFPDSMEVKIGVDADHSNMVKFRNKEEKAYKAAIAYLTQFEVDAVKVVAEKHRVISLGKVQPIFNIPFERDAKFTKRHDQEDKDILDIILNLLNSATHTRVSVVGLGGVGKSQVAIECSYRYSAKHPTSSVLWVSCRNKEAFEQSYYSIVCSLAIPGFDDPRQSPLDLLAAWLTDPRNGAWLIILDNADDIDMIHPRQPRTDTTEASFTYARYLPQASHGAFLLTTRDRDVANEFTGGQHVIPIGAMKNSEAVQFLHTRLPGTATDVSIEQLSQHLCYIPLAMSQAAAYIRANPERMTVERYLSLYENEDNQSLLLSAEHGEIRRDPGIPNSIINTWQISFNKIRQEAPKAADLLALMAMFDRQGIPEYILLGRFSNGLDFETALAPLLKFSLVISETGDGMLEMHRLVQLATQSWLRLTDSLHTWQGEAVLVLSNAFPSGKFENWARCQALLAHITKILQYHQIGDKILSKAEILLNLASYNLSRGEFSNAEKHARQSLAIRRQFLSDEDGNVLECNDCIAQAMLEQGQYQMSADIVQKLLEIRLKLLGPEHPDTLRSMNNLATLYRNQGRWDDAEELQVETLRIRKEKLGPEHQDTLISMNNLAITYTNQGRWKDAEELQVETSRIRKEKLGPEHPDTLISMNNLATTYMSQGRWDDAEELQVETLRILKEKLGPEHPDTLNSMGNLATTYMYQGRDDAEELQVEALRIRKEKLGPEHPDTLNSMNNLATMYMYQGRWDDAEELQVEALKFFKMRLGPEHQHTLSSMNNLATTYMYQGRDDAEELQVEALRIRKEKLGPEHPDTLNSMNNLATMYSDQGRWGDAEELQVEALRIRKEKLGLQHPYTLSLMSNLACSWEKLGRIAEAKVLMESCVEHSQRVLGPQHPHTRERIDILNSLGGITRESMAE